MSTDAIYRNRRAMVVGDYSHDQPLDPFGWAGWQGAYLDHRDGVPFPVLFSDRELEIDPDDCAWRDADDFLKPGDPNPVAEEQRQGLPGDHDSLRVSNPNT